MRYKLKFLLGSAPPRGGIIELVESLDNALFKRRETQKEEVQLELTCSTCGKPVAGKARTDVTRYLFKESRCQCGQPRLVVAEKEQEAVTSATALPCNEAASEKSKAENVQEQQTAKRDWQSAVLANLPEHFEVLSKIGEGGMGTVWKVRDKNLDKIFAVKVLKPWLVDNDEALLRFQQEAEAARNLTHVNLAAVYDFGMGKQGSPYLVMDYLEGDNLATIIEKEGCIDVPRAIDLFIQIAETVGHAHMKGVLHRDIKPTNIIIERNDQGVEMAKLVDFGIAKILPSEPGDTKGHTRTGDVFGSPPYMSPEQCLGNKLDASSDVYAFGCVMYETLVGRPPFTSENSIKTILQHLQRFSVPVRLAAKEQVIPHDLDYIVMRCLEKSPVDRYHSMQELQDDLEKLKSGKSIVRARKAEIIKPEKLDEVQALYRRQALANRWAVVAALAWWLPVMLLFFFGAWWGNTQFTVAEANHALKAYAYGMGDRTGKFNDSNSVSNYEYSLLMSKTDHFIEKLEDLARSYMAAKQYKKALSLLELASQHYRDSAAPTMRAGAVLQDIGICYKALGASEKALPAYMGALKIYQNRLSEEYIAISDEPEAVKARQCIKDLQEVLVKLHRLPEARMLDRTLQGLAPKSDFEHKPNEVPIFVGRPPY